MSQNRLFGETELVNAAILALRDRLPASWSVNLTQQRYPHEPYDGILTLSGVEGAVASFVVEAKSSTAGSAENTVNQLRVTSSTDDQPLLFISEYINPPLRRELEQAGISYLDTTGWAWLTRSDPTVMIRLEGANKPPRPRENKGTTRLNGPAATRAIRYLLQAQPPLGIRELADQSLTSAAAVSKMMPTLVDSGAIERSGAGTITLIRRRTMLDRWIADYSFLNSNGVVLDYLAPRGVSRTLKRIEGRDDIVVSGSAAAREYLPTGVVSVVPFGLLVLYCNDSTGVAKSLELVREDRRISNVMITKPRDSKLLDIAERCSSGFRVAPVTQVLADLLTLPRGRLAQEAEQLIDTLAATDASWEK